MPPLRGAARKTEGTQRGRVRPPVGRGHQPEYWSSVGSEVHVGLRRRACHLLAVSRAHREERARVHERYTLVSVVVLIGDAASCYSDGMRDTLAERARDLLLARELPAGRTCEIATAVTLVAAADLGVAPRGTAVALWRFIGEQPESEWARKAADTIGKLPFDANIDNETVNVVRMRDTPAELVRAGRSGPRWPELRPEGHVRNDSRGRPSAASITTPASW